MGGLCFTSGMDAGSTLSTASGSYRIHRLDGLEPGVEIGRLPYTLRILLENLLRAGDEAGVRAVAGWDPGAEPSHEVTFSPSRVLLQDFTGVPAVVDLAAIRDAVAELGGDPGAVEPRIPAELVIDHSVQVDEYASRLAFAHNVEFELERNRERYSFLRWGQDAFGALKVVPPGTGICHQVNLEYLARVVETRAGEAFPDTLVGTDSHTTMVNGLGVLGWGVGGIEAEAAMLGEPLSLLVPQVVGVFLRGALREGVTATDLVLTVTELLRSTGVVGKFVEYSGEGLAALSVADRATLANMSPEYGATCGFFPVDEATLAYLRLTGRSAAHVELVEAYCKENLLWHDLDRSPTYSERVELDLDGVEPSLAGPRRPQDRVPLRRVRESFLAALASFDVGQDRNGALAETFPASDPTTEQAPAGHRVPDPAAPSSSSQAPAHRAARVSLDGEEVELGDGTIVIAAITSCTNTSNPQVMVAAGLLAKKAVELGLRRAPWVKTSLAPGSRVVSDYLAAAGLQPYLDELGFDTVGYGCTTCIGNSGPLRAEVSAALAGQRPRHLRRAVREPQLRGAHPPRRQGELPRLPAARRRLRARRADRHRSPGRSAGADGPGGGRPPRRPLAELGRDPGDDRALAASRDVRAELQRRLHGGRGLARAPLGRRPALRLGRAIDLHPAARPTSRASRQPPARSRTCWGRAVSSRWATRSRPTTSHRPGRSGSTRRPAATWSTTGSPSATSTRTARAEGTTS